MKNNEIADIFVQIADLLEISGENVFRVNTYRNAARILQELPEDVGALVEAGTLDQVEGLGERTRQKIEEYLRTGKIAVHQELRQKVPPGLVDLLRIPGLGPKTILLAWKNLGVENLDGLQKAIHAGTLEKLPGMGPKKVENIQKGIDFLAQSRGRTPLGIARPRAVEITEALREIPGVRRVEFAGSTRRWAESIGDIDILIEAENGAAALIQFTVLPMVREVLAVGETKASVRIDDNVQVDVRVVARGSFGAAWQYFTGSKAHNIKLREIAVRKGWKLNEYGLFSGEKSLAGETEESVYKKLGLPCFPPEIREDRGEIENADRLPNLVELSDLKGDLHMHTDASDGHHTAEELIEAAIGEKFEYLCISDHSQSSKIANGLDEKRMASQIKTIRKLAEQYRSDILVLLGSEVDILADGRLDYPDAILGELDLTIGSIHSALGQPAEKITDRLLRAMDNPYVRMIGHLTGRLIGQREPSKIDVLKVINHAAATGTWLELNAHWQRLDLNDVHCRQAKEAGVKIAICSDSHDLPHLDNLVYGVYTARRGWIESKDVINTLPAQRLKSLLGKRKG